jgi:general secretion pathway protein I
MSCSTGSPAGCRSSSSGGAAQARRRGFTLIEILVALVILTVALGALLQLFSTGMRSASSAEARTIAVLLAQSRLAALGVETPLEPGESDGAWDERYRWTATIDAYEDEATIADEDAAGLVPFRVSVTVSWDEPPRGGSVTLTSLRLAPAGEAGSGR